ncbi:MAG: hypothetical protein AB1728_15130 [Bacteroidota bacterium]
MDQNTLNDFNNIFENRLPNLIVIILDLIFDLQLCSHPNTFRIKTRNDKNEILNYSGERYFSFIQISQESPVVFAGTLVQNSKGIIVPAIRFRDENVSLREVPAIFKFPYRKPNWTYVEIHNDSISYFRNLIDSQIRFHLSA